MFNYPHGDLHGLNLDWFLEQWKKFQNSFTSAFTARITQVGVNDDPSINVTYDQNTGIYDFDFNLPEEVKPTGYEIGYQEGISGTTIPTGSWLANPPAVTQGNYLWSRTRVIYNNGTYSATYAVSRMGVDGAGSPATQNPLMDGTVSVGSSYNFAREDHRHPSDTSRLAVSALSNTTPQMNSGAGASGSSVTVSRADHVHPSDTSKLNASDFVLSTSSPAMDGIASAGSSTNVSRADHVHPTDTSRASATDVANLQTASTDKVLYLKNISCSAITGNFVSLSNSAITASHVLAECVFNDMTAITTDVSWTTNAGELTINGTCTFTTTCNIVLIKKDN